MAWWRDAAVMMIMTPLHWASRCPAPVTLAITLRNTLYYTHSYHYTAQAVLLINSPWVFPHSLAKILTFLSLEAGHFSWILLDFYPDFESYGTCASKLSHCRCAPAQRSKLFTAELLMIW